MRTPVRGYVLAGGRSSRMGTDKAVMRFGGETLLEIAIGRLRRLCEEVVVVGERESAPDGVRTIPDVRSGCGPMGGMAAALRDAGAGSAMFLPVDMPLIPGELLERIVNRWFGSDAAVCLLVVDGRLQPLLSLVQGSLQIELEAALERGNFKIGPVLEHGGGGVVVRTEISTAERTAVWPDWEPTDAQWSIRELWFANLNTPEEFARAESASMGLRH